MIVMQGSDAVLWFWCESAIAVLSIVAIWYMVIVGRDRPADELKPKEDQIEQFGDVAESHAPVPKFLLWTYVLTAFWAVCYLCWTGTNGLI